jgi:hypothetical protein
MAGPSRVDFVIAGVQKGGTTALFEYLADSPEIALSRVKETHFFDDETRDWARPDYDAYHAFFDDPAGRVCGEATPIYSYWPGSLERIFAYNRAMRLILVLRDPVERAWSHWRMEFARGAETRPFAWCVREGRQRLFEAGAHPWGHHREFSYVERGFYGEQVERALELFPREQLLVLRSEALKAEPGESLAEVRRFLGLAPGAPPAPREAHVGTTAGFPSELSLADREHLRSLYARDQARLGELTGVSFP